MKLTQEELLEQFLMEDLPSLSDMRCSATHEPAVAVDVARDMVSDLAWTEINEMVIQKSTPTGANFHLWRKASLAINACNRMRLVVESLRALDKKTANQTVTEINSLFSSPIFNEAVLARLPDCSTTVKRQCRSIIIGTSSLPAFVPSFYRTNSGKVRIVFESVEPVEQENTSQIADHLIALVDGTIPNTGSGGRWETPATPGTVFADNANEWIDELIEDEPYQFSFDDLGDVVGSSNSETGFVPNLDQAAQSRINNPSTPDTTMSVHPLVHGPMEGIQHSPTMSVHPLVHGPMDSVQHAPVRGTFCDRTPYQTASERWERDNGGWPNQERHQNSDSEPQMQLRKYQECRQWNDLISSLINHITAKIEKIDQASDRAKLKIMEQEAYSTSSSLNTIVHKFKGIIEKLLKDIRSVVEKYTNAVPQRLLKAVSTLIEDFQLKSVNMLGRDTERVSKKLITLGKDLRFRELSASKIAQDCASSLTTLVQSFLTEQSVNFFPVADITKR